MKAVTRRGSLARLAGLATAATIGACAVSAPPRSRQHFVLIHGGWHGAWCWDRVAARLRKARHTVTAPDLPAHGADRTPVEAVSLASYVRTVTDVLDAAPDPVVLVGHSIGGMTISQAAEARPERVRTLVYLSALVMADGETASSRRDGNSALNALVKVELRSGSQAPLLARLDTVDAARVREALYHDCDEADALAAMARLGPEPLGPWFEPMRLTPARFGTVDKVYLHCSDDPLSVCRCGSRRRCRCSREPADRRTVSTPLSTPRRSSWPSS